MRKLWLLDHRSHDTGKRSRKWKVSLIVDPLHEKILKQQTVAHDG
jgi:hypothetical protein